MKNIIFIAPPASGKGTQSRLISHEYKIPHISIGEIMRGARDANTEIGRIIIECQDERKLVPLDITLKLIKTRLNSDDCDNGYILDGFPRNLEQAIEYDKILSNINKNIDLVIYMDIDRELALKRTLSRRICSKCGETYNLLDDTLKPLVDNTCNKCGSELSTRSDDNEVTFNKGFDLYLEETLPLIYYYEQRGILRKIKIESTDTVQDIFNKLKSIIG